MAKATEKITKRDRYELLISALAGEVELTEENKKDLTAFCENEIDLLDKKAAKAKETASKSKASTDELTSVVRDALTNDFLTINEIVAKIADEDVTNGKVSYRLNALVEAGVAESQEVKVTTGNSKRTLKAYRLINAD